MPPVYEHPIDVTHAEIDMLGHVNNLVYLQWMIDAAVAHSSAQGWSGQRYLDLGSGWIVRSHWIKYLQPAFVDDRITVRTWVAETRRATSRRRYEILRVDDAARLATASTDWAFIDFQRQTPVRIPPEVSDAFIALGDEPPGDV
jgi:acyl-CoA thioester hydrolase